MKLIELTNPSDKDIVDYKIEEIEFDQNGEPMIDQLGNTKKTGRTLEWTLNAGETMKFPDYVAYYLKGIYDFLQVTKSEKNPDVNTEVKEETNVPESKTKKVAQPTEGGVICRFCGKSLKGVKGVALHIAHEHPEELLKGVSIE